MNQDAIIVNAMKVHKGAALIQSLILLILRQSRSPKTSSHRQRISRCAARDAAVALGGSGCRELMNILHPHPDTIAAAGGLAMAANSSRLESGKVRNQRVRSKTMSTNSSVNTTDV